MVAGRCGARLCIEASNKNISNVVDSINNEYNNELDYQSLFKPFIIDRFSFIIIICYLGNREK